MNEFEEQDYNKKFDFSIWKKMFKYASSYKKKITVLGFLMVLIAGVDAVFPLFSKYAIDNFIIPQTFSGFPLFCILMFATISIQAMNVNIMIKIAGRIETEIPYDIRKEGFQKLQELPLSYYDKTPVGWLMARMTSDIKKLGNTLSWNLVDLVWSVTLMILIIVSMIFINFKLALYVLALMPFLITISIVFQKLILKYYRLVRKANSHITNSFNEGIMGAKTIKTLVTEKECLKEFQKSTQEYKGYSIKTATAASLYTPIVILLGSIGTAAVLWKGGSRIMAGTLSYGTLVAFISYTIQFFEPVKQLARVLSEVQYAQASAERIISLIETEADIKDSEKVIDKYGKYTDPNMEKWPKIKGEITFKDLSFSYKNGENVLKDFNLKIKSGETIAIVGETGSGKTTIVNLACRFYEPTSGNILIDGVDYRERPLLWLHSNIGYVLQEPHLFSGTVSENIAYSSANVSKEEIINASKLVNAHDFIIKLEKGYDTEVGERGSKLSTGQKQLISFARAILANPSIFILDEATASVDTETEDLIQSAIHNVLEGRTSFIIAHRLSTVKSADRILVIEKGKIIEEGTHKQLLHNKGYYYRLYTNQFLDEQENSLLNKPAALLL